MEIYVGNLATETSLSEVRSMFEAHGQVKRVRLARSKQTGEARGYGYVEMEEGPARAAIAALHASQSGDQRLKVRPAKPRSGGAADRV